MAQMGSYVPAAYAAVRMTDALFTRINNEDDPKTNASTLMVELRDVAFILRHVTPRSLVLMDELGRATTLQDGYGLAVAVAEKASVHQGICFLCNSFL